LKFFEGGLQMADEQATGRELTIWTKIVPGVITNNFPEIRDAMRADLEQYRGVEFTEESAKDAKKLLAQLRKYPNEIDSRRKQSKKDWMSPFTKFEDEVKEFVDEMNEIITPIEQQVAQFEQKRIDQKRIEIDEEKMERLAKEEEHIEAYIRKLTWFDNPKWENSSVSMTRIRREIDEKVAGIKADLEALDVFGEGNANANAIALHYQRTGSLAESIALKKQLEQAESDRLARENAKKEQEIEQPKENPHRTIGTEEPPKFMQEKQETVEVKDDPIIEAKFRVRAERSKIQALAAFMKEQGILYGPIKE